MNGERLCVVCILFSLFLMVLTGMLKTSSAGEEAKHLLREHRRTAVLDRLAEVQGDIKTFQSDFSEARMSSGLKKPILFKGRLFYDAEGLFFMDYHEPVESILRIKGGEALFYVKGSPTADIVGLPGANGMAGQSNPFLWNPSGFKGRVWEYSGFYLLEKTRSGDNGDHDNQSISIFLDRETLLVKRILMVGRYGDTTEISLKEPEINGQLPQGVLEFVLPEGTVINRVERVP